MSEHQEIILNGIAASPGISIGKAYIVGREGVDVVKQYYIMDSLLLAEKNRFKAAVEKGIDELRAIIKTTPEELREHANILETHIVLLKDKMLYGKVIETIEKDRVNAEWALKKVVSSLKSIFNNMTDSYFKERAMDIVHVSDLIMRNLVGVKYENIRDISKRVILVAEDLSPAETSQIQLEKVKGFVTDLGGKASHTGIIARTLEIPAVVGLNNATRQVVNDDVIIVDGSEGLLIIHPTEETLIEYEDRKLKYESYRSKIARGSDKPAKTKDGFSIRVMGNIELLEEIVSVIDHGGDGIGLYRTEFDYISRSEFPNEQDLYEKYKDIVEVMHKKPVTIRTLDINGDKAFSMITGAKEKNPALGLRGIRYCLRKMEVFKTQLRAILKASALYRNIRVMFPMVSGMSEIIEAKQVLNEVAEDLDKQGCNFDKKMKIGIMIEVPSAVILADELAQEVDFFSIGTNDLIQYSLAIDRGNPNVAHLYNPLHPAIIRMIKLVADAAKRNAIPVYMCGEMAAEPVHAPILLGLGIDELSMNPQSIPAIKNTVRLLNYSDVQSFVGDILRQKTTSDIIQLVQDAYGEIISFPFTKHNK